MGKKPPGPAYTNRDEHLDRDLRIQPSKNLVAVLNALARIGARGFPYRPANLPYMRTWSDIARELARETDPTRVRELAEELNHAMEEQRFAESTHTPPVPTR